MPSTLAMVEAVIGRAIRGDLGRQPIPGPLLDQDIDQRQPLVFVDRFGSNC